MARKGVSKSRRQSLLAQMESGAMTPKQVADKTGVAIGTVYSWRYYKKKPNGPRTPKSLVVKAQSPKTIKTDIELDRLKRAFKKLLAERYDLPWLAE